MGGGEGAAGDTVIGWMGGQALFNEEASLVKPTVMDEMEIRKKPALLDDQSGEANFLHVA